MTTYAPWYIKLMVRAELSNRKGISKVPWIKGVDGERGEFAPCDLQSFDVLAPDADEGSERSLHETMAAPAEQDRADDSSNEHEVSHFAIQLLDALPPKDRQIVQLRLGLERVAKYKGRLTPWPAVARRMKLSVRRTREIFDESIARLRNRSAGKSEKASDRLEPGTQLEIPLTF